MIASLINRAFNTLIVDCTSLVQIRHPQESGGAQWLSSLVLTMASLPPSIKIYEYRGGDGNAIKLAWKVVWLVPHTSSFS